MQLQKRVLCSHRLVSENRESSGAGGEAAGFAITRSGHADRSAYNRDRSARDDKACVVNRSADFATFWR